MKYGLLDCARSNALPVMGASAYSVNAEAKKLELGGELDRIQKDGHLLDLPANMETYRSYLAHLRALMELGGEEMAAIKTKLVQRTIHQVVVYPTEVKIQFKVGSLAIRQGLGELNAQELAGNKKAESQAFAPVIPLGKKSFESGSKRLLFGSRGRI